MSALESSGGRLLAGKSLVVVGGTSGPGLSAAQAFVTAGASVVIVGRNRANLERAAHQLGEHAIPIAADARDPATAARAIAQAVAAFGRLDGLYHAGGGRWPRVADGPLHMLSDEAWRLTLDVQLSSVMYSNRAAIRQFLHQGGGGAVLNLGSVIVRSPSADGSALHAFTAAKAGVAGLSRALAASYAHAQIRINVLAPPPLEPDTGGPVVEVPVLARHQPLGRGGYVHSGDLDAAAVFFLSDGGRWATGQVLEIDGGWGVASAG